MAHALPADNRIPVMLLTGFLGSGKTTVLNHLLGQPELSGAAVIINEFGDIGLDHELVTAVSENMVLLQSGCLCCTIRGDLVEALHDLLEKSLNGQIPRIDRVVLETTGLADPAPIIHTLITDQVLMSNFRLDGIIVTVDAATGGVTLDAQEEAVKQAAMADRILLTKTDLASPQDTGELETRLRALNPGTPIIHVRNGKVDPAPLLETGLYDPNSKSADVQAWLNAEAYAGPGSQHEHHHDHHHHHEGHEDAHHHDHHHHDDLNRHDDRISAVSYTVDHPISAARFETWLEALMVLCGPNVLRLKGIVNVEGEDLPLVIHGVQHILHPPIELNAWPSDDRRTRIVLIGRDLDDDFFAECFGYLGALPKQEHHHHEHEKARA